MKAILLSFAHSLGVVFGLAAFSVAVFAQPAAPRAIAAAGASPPSEPRFEVASIKVVEPNRTNRMFATTPWGSSRFSETNTSLRLMLQVAFGVEDYQIVGLPSWDDSQSYDVEARAEEGNRLTYEEVQPRLQHLLEERLGLKVHRETKEISGYALVVAPSGAKLKPTDVSPSSGYFLANQLRTKSASVRTLASMLGHAAGNRPVEDKTGISGNYDINLRYAPQDGSGDTSLPSFFTAVQEQLGLKLQAAKVPVKMLVVDHVERVPTEN